MRSNATGHFARVLVLAATSVALLTDTGLKAGHAGDGPVECTDSKTVRFRVGVRLRANQGAVQRAVASVAAPIDWPEQKVQVLRTEKPGPARLETRRLAGTAELMLFTVPRLGGGDSIDLTRTYEVTRWTQRLDPAARERLQPTTASTATQYLLPSDGIESTHREIRQFASETIGQRSGLFEQVSALFDATRARVQYQEGPFKGALTALREGAGDCEERSCLFIALCRAAGIPARLVWGPGHAWAEFAASDNGQLVWVPAEPTKEREPGVVRHFYPILQKGDRFRLPDVPGQTFRYLNPRCTALGSQIALEHIEELDPPDAFDPAKKAPGKGEQGR